MKNYSIVCLFGILSLLTFLYGTALPLYAQEPSYGAAETLGPALEACATEATVANAVVIEPSDDWEGTLTSAQPGTTLLFHAGTYQASTKLWLPAGAPDQFITLKPYNCEQVTLYASLRPLSYTVIAGLTIEAQGTTDTNYVIRIDSEYKGAYWGNITQVTIRNNLIRGGLTDAIRISDDITYITITGNQIDGGATGHNIFVTSEKLQQRPDQIVITNNKFTKQLFTTPAEDMLQVRDVGYVAFTNNTCTSGLNMEQCIDIKTTTTPLLIAYNLFDGTQLHLLGAGEDSSDGCMVIHESDQVAEQHLIEHNYFKQCKGSSIRFASGSEEGLTSSGLVRYNLFFQTSYQAGAIPVVKAQAMQFSNNTMICGYLKLGSGDQTKLPSNTLIKNNIFYKTKIEDNTQPEFPYTCAYNLLFATTGSGFTVGGCSSTIETDPAFVAAANADFRLLPTSPALHSGENNIDLGALALFQSPAIQDLPLHLYLPLIQQSQATEILCTP